MIKKYNKLVRDKVPDNINKKQGVSCTYEILDIERYNKELDKKLLEEAKEYVENHSIEEMGDLLEVIRTIMEVRSIPKDKLDESILAKREEKGSFKNRVFLKEVEE